ncbi:hypothetical protein [Acetobacter oeni]|uniref:hypothetical protein n=1 Tax=Acetobacter oeni TaxID=304077 RepID=UPI001A7E5BAB|nr:hypothetical protein [Acetobacter oeni]
MPPVRQVRAPAFQVGSGRQPGRAFNGVSQLFSVAPLWGRFTSRSKIAGPLPSFAVLRPRASARFRPVPGLPLSAPGKAAKGAAGDLGGPHHDPHR